jgi:hypothetical protein
MRACCWGTRKRESPSAFGGASGPLPSLQNEEVLELVVICFGISVFSGAQRKTPQTLICGAFEWWRPRSESNRRRRICNPEHNHFATRPQSSDLVACASISLKRRTFFKVCCVSMGAIMSAFRQPCNPLNRKNIQGVQGVSASGQVCSTTLPRRSQPHRSPPCRFAPAGFCVRHSAHGTGWRCGRAR